MQAMTEPAPARLRLAYIRTVAHSGSQTLNIREFLSAYVRQSRPEELADGAPRHRFLFGAGTTFDATVLDVLIVQIQARTAADIQTPVIGWPSFQYMSRSDLELHVPISHATTTTGKKLLKRCADEGIPTVISGVSNEECDELMLQMSHYLIDFLTHEYCHTIHTHFPHYFRPGIPEDNILTNMKYNMNRHDVSKHRLRNRYAGYGWRQSSGGYHGNGGDYSCVICGGKCKRGICKGTQIDVKRMVEQQKWVKTEEAWIEDTLNLPTPGNEKWRGLTAEDLCWRFHMLSLPRYKDAKRWHSIDTFSGE
jgi:hypothetical protein